MDVDKAWSDFAAAIAAKMSKDAAGIAEDIMCWIAVVGFPPKITGMPEFDTIIRRATCNSVAAVEAV